jgi:hypothetical protein
MRKVNDLATFCGHAILAKEAISVSLYIDLGGISSLSASQYLLHGRRAHMAW